MSSCASVLCANVICANVICASVMSRCARYVVCRVWVPVRVMCRCYVPGRVVCAGRGSCVRDVCCPAHLVLPHRIGMAGLECRDESKRGSGVYICVCCPARFVR
eukprot:222380-Pelagomonas_calceolata.AAC.6